MRLLTENGAEAITIQMITIIIDKLVYPEDRRLESDRLRYSVW